MSYPTEFMLSFLMSHVPGLKGAVLMKFLIVLLLLVVLPGCATHLAESGRRIKVFSSGDSTTLKNCEQLGRVTGEAGSFLSGGEYGVVYATIDARNKAGRILGADTLEVVNDEPRRLGGEVAGNVYNCLTPRNQTAHVPVVPKSAGAGKAAPVTQGKDLGNIFEKAKKCQSKGGVWVNDSCIIQID
jgi:hypothetical protein